MGNRDNDPVEVNCTYVRRAGASIVIEDADGKEKLLPLSQIKLDPERPDPLDDLTVTMPEWLAVDRELV